MRSSRAAALLALLVAPGAPPGPRDAAPPGEYEVKAAFLYNFAKYVEWPTEAPAAQAEAFVVTVVGEDPFGAVLDDTLRDKTIGGRRVVLRRVVHWDDIGSSQIVFISASESAQLPRILKSLDGAAVLTVGETERFAERGGVIRFKTDGDRIRLEINLAVAARARLKISSELLKLARIVGLPKGG